MGFKAQGLRLKSRGSGVKLGFTFAIFKFFQQPLLLRLVALVRFQPARVMDKGMGLRS